MKAKVLFQLVLATILPLCLMAGNPTIRAQLETVNKQWKVHKPNFGWLDKQMFVGDESGLIQLHLFLVEKALRNKSNQHLSKKQLLNRLVCLDILNRYTLEGIFPKNLHHNNRTPYFIDDYGTVCAVGQLLISTGFSDLAHKIKRQRNNAYLSELSETYTEIIQWANTYGFTVEELAWIQPSYCRSNSPGILNVTCKGGNDGYFRPDVSNLQGPLGYTLYAWSSKETWVPAGYFALSPPGCNLVKGYYKMLVEDGAGKIHDYYAMITEPSAVVGDYRVSGNPEFCRATATVYANGGEPPYRYAWPQTGSLSNISGHLCATLYQAYAQDSKGCSTAIKIPLGEATTLSEYSEDLPNFSPNPFTQQLSLQIPNFFKPNETFLCIYDLTGTLCFRFQLNSDENTIDIPYLKPGVYMAQVSNGTKTFWNRLIRE